MSAGRSLFAALSGALWAVSVATAQQVEVGLTLQGASGRFIFEDATTSWMLLGAASLQADRWRVGVSAPGIFQNSSALSYVGGVPIGTGGPNGGTVAGRGSGSRVPGRRRASGLIQDPTSASPTVMHAMTVDSGFVEAPGAYRFVIGDPIINAGLDVLTSDDGTRRVAVQAFAKLPLASVESGVGTGAADIGASLSGSTRLGRALVALDLSHWIVGDLPDLPLRDITGLMLGIGGAFGWTGQHSLLLSGSVATAAVAGTEAPRSIALSYGRSTADGRSVNIGAALGLTESVADWTLWLGWRLPVAK